MHQTLPVFHPAYELDIPFPFLFTFLCPISGQIDNDEGFLKLYFEVYKSKEDKKLMKQHRFLKILMDNFENQVNEITNIFLIEK